MLEPFSGWLVKPDRAEQVVIPPYDLLTPTDRQELLQANSDSFLHAILDPSDHPGDDRLELSRQAVERLAATRMEPRFQGHFAAYRLSTSTFSTTGLVGLMTYSNLRWTSVHGHEQVKPDRVRLLADYLVAVRASSSPAAVTVLDEGELRASLADLTDREPDLTVAASPADGTLQEVWILDASPDLVRLAASFDPIYVVDGHHRIAAAVAVKDVPILGVVFPASELHLESFHRVLGPITQAERSDLLVRLAGGTEVESSIRSPRSGTVVVWLDGRAYELAVRQPELLALHETVIPNVDPRTDPRLRYVAANAEVSLADGEVAFFVPPLAADYVFETAASGRTMPPKATRFFPKARSGLFLNRQ